MTAAPEGTPRAGGPGIRASAVRAAMRLMARRLARQASLDAISTRQPPLPDAARGARSILVIALAEAGDMVLLSVFLHGLRELAPRARISLVCLPAVAALLERSPDVDEVIAYDAAMPRLLRPLLLPRRARTFVRRLLSDRFDVAIVPRWDTDQHLAAAVAAFGRAPRRVWHTEQANPRKAVLNAGFDALFTDIVTSRGIAHEVERHLEMLRALGAVAPSSALRIAMTDEDRANAAAALRSVGAPGPLVALGIGAAHPKRRWPISRFAAVGRSLQEAHGAHLLLVGGPDDVEAQKALLRELGDAATGVAGRLSWRESAAALERCRPFVGCDSAPMHLAAAVGVPCVEISCHPAGGDPLHNNAPERFAPWGVPHLVVRPDAAVPPCTSSCRSPKPHCILAVTTAMVATAAESLLRQTASSELRAPIETSRP